MRVLVTGAHGMLGQDVVTVLGSAGHDVHPVGRSDLDICSPTSVERGVRDVDVVVNCAAWTAVDDAETREAEAFAVNAVGAQLLARAARKAGAAIVQVSTDYVFDGAGDQPYAEDHALSPQSAYGRSKAAGEWAVRSTTAQHWVLRTAWLYGAHGGCFPRTIARLAADRDRLDVVADQVGQPTWTRDVAAQIVALLATGAPWGVYHATASGEASWHDFASAVVDAAGARTAVAPTTTAAFPRPAPRPAWSVLGHEAWRRAEIEPIGDWRERWSTAADEVLGIH